MTKIVLKRKQAKDDYHLLDRQSIAEIPLLEELRKEVWPIEIGL